MITELSVEKCGGYMWCVPSESTNAEYFVQWLFTLWKTIVMFNSCILMYTCTVSLMRWLGFFCFFFNKLLFLLSGFLQILKMLNLHVWEFHIFLFVFRNWNQKIRNQKKKNSPLMNACFCSYFWRYYITQLDSSMTFF